MRSDLGVKDRSEGVDAIRVNHLEDWRVNGPISPRFE